MALSTIRKMEDGEWQQVEALIERTSHDYGVLLSEYDLDDNSFLGYGERAEETYKARQSLKRRYRYLMKKLDLPTDARWGYGYWGLHVD